MCGIAGFIGEPSNPKLSYELITRLFEQSERRGVDAAGFWGIGADGSAFHYKQPGPASALTQAAPWGEVSWRKPSLLIVHARAASVGVGPPCDNANNHPFLSADESVALVHNGRLDDRECETLLGKYEASGRCDSELLLHVFLERGGLYGVRDIFRSVPEGHMAVAIGERGRLWLFRNEHRPLWVVDVRGELGQVFFVSEPCIWERAASGLPIFSARLVELPPGQAWLFEAGKPVRKFLARKLPYQGYIRRASTHFQGGPMRDFIMALIVLVLLFFLIAAVVAFVQDQQTGGTHAAPDAEVVSAEVGSENALTAECPRKKERKRLFPRLFPRNR